MPNEGSFGQRLAELRNDAGLSQRQLANVTGISYRMIAYYEGRDTLPPGHALPLLADALGVTVDRLVGKKSETPPRRSAVSQRLLRRLQQLERLPLRERKALLAIIDTYLEKHRLEQRGH